MKLYTKFFTFKKKRREIVIRFGNSFNQFHAVFLSGLEEGLFPHENSRNERDGLEEEQRLMYVVPMTLVIIFVIIYLNTRSTFKTLIVLLAVPFSLIGAILGLRLTGDPLSMTAIVGVILLAAELVSKKQKDASS